MSRLDLRRRTARASGEFRRALEQADQRAASLRASGNPVFTGSVNVPRQRRGLISRESTWAASPIAGRNVSVSVYQRGLLLSYPTGGQRAILAPEIEQVRLIGKWWWSRVVIWHHAPHVQDPLFLFTARDGAAAAAILSVLGPQSSGLLRFTPPLRDQPPEG